MAKKLSFKSEFLWYNENLKKAKNTLIKKWSEFGGHEKDVWKNNSKYFSADKDGSFEFFDFYLRKFSMKNKDSFIENLTFNLRSKNYDKRQDNTWSTS